MKNRSILLVEDNQDDVELMMRALEKNKITNKVVLAEDGEKAVEYLAGCAEGEEELPAVVLLDLKLPKMSGLEVLQEIRSDKRISLLPVVVLTSSKEEEDIARAYKMGCNSYVRKPVDFEKFTASVKDLGLYWLLLNEIPEVKKGEE